MRSETAPAAGKKLYLICGFLGAGKTTLLRELVLSAGQARARVIVNEFGREGVDGELLSGLAAETLQIAGGSVFCACRIGQFEAALADACASDAELIFVEASGFSDPSGMAALIESGRFPALAYRGAVCVVDARRFKKSLATALCCARQVAGCGLCVVNRADTATEEEIAETRSLVRALNPDCGIFVTSYGLLPQDFLARLSPKDGGARAGHPPDLTLQRVLLRVNPRAESRDVAAACQRLMRDACRAKGLITAADGAYYIDAVPGTVACAPWHKKAGDALVVLAGRGMHLRAAVKRILKESDAFTGAEWE